MKIRHRKHRLPTRDVRAARLRRSLSNMIGLLMETNEILADMSWLEEPKKRRSFSLPPVLWVPVGGAS